MDYDLSTPSNGSTTRTPTPTNTPSGARIKDITFENGSLTHPTSGADSVTGNVVLNNVSLIKGVYSAIIPNAGSSYLDENFTGVDDLYVSFYLKVNALPTSDVRIALISNAGTTTGNIMLRTTGALRLRNGSTTIGADSVALTVGSIYRVGIRQKRGTGGNAILEGYLASGDNAFGVPFASTATGTWTTQGDRLRLGATTSSLVNIAVDDIRLDSQSMPPPSDGTPSTPTATATNTLSGARFKDITFQLYLPLVLNNEDSQRTGQEVSLRLLVTPTIPHTHTPGQSPMPTQTTIPAHSASFTCMPTLRWMPTIAVLPSNILFWFINYMHCQRMATQ